MVRSPRVDQLGLVRLDEDECWEVLERHHIGRIAVIEHGRPLIFPVNYALHGRTVVFRTAPGTKLAAAALGQEVAFEVDEADALFHTGTSVMVHGRARVAGAEEQEQLETLALRPWAPGDRDDFVCIEPRWLSGRRLGEPGEADGLGADAG